MQSLALVVRWALRRLLIEHDARQQRDPSVTRGQANLRFSTFGRLMTAPPEHGQLASHIVELAAKAYQHPTTGEQFITRPR